MIGVISKQTEIDAVQEFFQLFKTPWEFYIPDRSYDLVITTSDRMPSGLCPRALAIYSSRRTGIDDEIGVARSKRRCEWLEWDGLEFPIYGDLSVQQARGRPIVRRRGEREIVGLEVSDSTRQTVRVGYDLFQEVAFLLSNGQPAANAHIPTLEIHISLLRKIMVAAGVPFVEIPPAPAGYDFMACMTHDVAFPG